MEDLGVRVAKAPPALQVFRDDAHALHAYAVFLANTHLTSRYVHWDEVRHLQPPGDLTPEEWWHAIKLGRAPQLRPLPFSDAQGFPFVYTVPGEAVALLHVADRRCSEVPAPAQAAPRNLVDTLMEEAIRTSQLAGSLLPQSDAKALLRTGRAPAGPDEQMVVDAHGALRFVREGLGNALAPADVVELNRRFTGSGALRPGARLRRLCDFANGLDEGSGFLHPVARAILLHFRVASERPFEDGNGRTGRALFSWSLRAQGYPLIDYLSLSRVLDYGHSQYRRAFLLTEADDRDTTYFVLHQLEALERAIGELDAYLARKAAEMRTAAAIAGDVAGLNDRQLALLGDALAHPNRTHTFLSHARTHDVTHETARQDLLALQARGLLARRKLGRRFAFAPAPGLLERMSVAS